MSTKSQIVEQILAIDPEAETEGLTKAELEKLLEKLEKQTASMAEQLRKYRGNYKTSIAGSGAKSLSNGDDLAKFLEMKTPKEVCEIADQACGEDLGFHFAKYEKLNLGQIRMNAGNKIRARWRKGEFQLPSTN